MRSQKKKQEQQTIANLFSFHLEGQGGGWGGGWAFPNPGAIPVLLIRKRFPIRI